MVNAIQILFVGAICIGALAEAPHIYFFILLPLQVIASIVGIALIWSWPTSRVRRIFKKKALKA
jgi:hypothetical protein